jgi:hypothetical protein
METRVHYCVENSPTTRHCPEPTESIPHNHAIPYYFEYKTTSNLRRIQFLNVGFKEEKLKRWILLEFKTHLNFSTGKHV